MKMLPLKQLTLFFLLLGTLWPFSARTEIVPARLFADHMVLQQKKLIPVWGWGNPGEAVRVTFLGKTYRAKTDRTGKWMLNLDPASAGGPFEMTIAGPKNQTVLKDILIGEVWVCSGQSNMEWAVRVSANAKEEIAAANDPLIRHFAVPRAMSTQPLKEISGGAWEVCSPETVGEFTAVGYFFARQLREKLQVPIGLVNTTWGGTVAETWVSPEAIRTMSAFANAVKAMENFNEKAFAQQQREAMAKLIGEIPEKDTGFQGDNSPWAQPGFDDSAWKEMALPSPWEQKGLENLDGILWFRLTLELTAQQAETASTLHLGPVDDADITWVNGTKVGETSGYNIARKYALPKGLLKAGKNTLVVRVIDTGGFGGFTGKEGTMLLETSVGDIDLGGNWKYKVGQANISTGLSGPNSLPSLLYNAMIHPLLPFAMQGVIWYQGESNTGRAYQYRELFPLLIRDWRKQWRQGEFPFYWVQLANFMQPTAQPSDSEWAELREAQTLTGSLPFTGQAVIIDIGEADDIHPRNKQDVGYRLALQALMKAYGLDLLADSPMFSGMEKEGGVIKLRFDHVGDGLVVKDKYGYLKGFAIAGADRKFHWAKATLIGPNEIWVSADAVPDPVAVRYAWGHNPDDVNIYSSVGLPMCPFRTDDWPIITRNRQ